LSAQAVGMVPLVRLEAAAAARTIRGWRCGCYQCATCTACDSASSCCALLNGTVPARSSAERVYIRG
jgi:hypothetical protein